MPIDQATRPVRAVGELPPQLRERFALAYHRARQIRADAFELARLLDDAYSAVWTLADGDDLAHGGDYAADRLTAELGLGPIRDLTDRAVELLTDWAAVHGDPRPVRPWPVTAWPLTGETAR